LPLRPQPKHLKISLVGDTVNEGDFSLKIEDNGKPFQSQHTNSEGRGLANMRARAGLIDARISWEPRENGGTVFSLTRAATANARVS